MTKSKRNKDHVDIKIESVSELSPMDISDLCDATESTITEDALSFTIGLNRSEPMARDRLEKYWNGVLLVPERQLIIGRVDGTIAASIQLVKPAPSHQTSAFAGSVDHHFVAPWARGHRLAKALLQAAEDKAISHGLTLLKLSVRANLRSAIKLYDSCGYKRWGTLDQYEIVDGKMLAGYFYCKELAAK